MRVLVFNAVFLPLQRQHSKQWEFMSHADALLNTPCLVASRYAELAYDYQFKADIVTDVLCEYVKIS